MSTKEEKPHLHWEKVVLAAYLRMMGHTQEEAGAAVNRAERTVRVWEADKELWEKARQEGRRRWYEEAADAARQSVLRGVRRNPELGFRFLEKIDPELAPPKQRHEVTGEGGGPMEVTVIRRIVRPGDGDGDEG
jgi:hypothetical protein